MHWLFRVLAEGWVLWVAGVAGGIVLTVVRTYWPQMADGALYGLAGFLLVVGILVFIRLERYLHAQEPKVNEGNVESVVRGFIDNFGLGYQRVPANEFEAQAFFASLIVIPPGRKVVVYRPKQRPRYIHFQSSFKAEGVYAQQIDQLTPEQREVFWSGIRSVLSQAGQESLLELTTKEIAVVARLPISTLTEHGFMTAVDRVAIGQILAFDAMANELRRVTPGLVRP